MVPAYHIPQNVETVDLVGRAPAEGPATPPSNGENLPAPRTRLRMAESRQLSVWAIGLSG